MKNNIFLNRTVLIATKHQKETVIAPILENEMGVHCFTSDFFDTDSLGTFSGEILRKDNALNTLRTKCELGFNNTNCDLVIASEGSFGAHPTLFFASANEELVMLKDFKNDIEIIAREISLDTNFNGKIVFSEDELLEFATLSHFPAHGIILKSTEINPLIIEKGIVSKKILLEKYRELHKTFSSVFVETDMRAQFNPTRMKVIEKATLALLKKIKNCCTRCETPGFDIINTISGLPCRSCGSPTRSTLSHIYQCKKCEFKEEKIFPRGLQFEEPTYCDYCNP